MNRYTFCKTMINKNNKNKYKKKVRKIVIKIRPKIQRIYI